MDTAFQAFAKYVGLKAHFESDYDYFKYRGKTRTKVTTFEKRRDKYFFAKLVKKPHYEKILLANIVDNPNHWIGDVIGAEGEEVYLRWSKRMDQLGYNYKQDLQKLNDDFNSNLIVENGRHPHLLELYLQKEIMLETLIVLDELTHFSKRWDKQIEEQYVWPPISTLMKKYRPFLQLNLDRLKHLTIERFS